MTQSRLTSARETTWQVLVGGAVSYAFTLYILPYIQVWMSDPYIAAGAITLAYAGISWVRGYLIRRAFA